MLRSGTQYLKSGTKRSSSVVEASLKPHVLPTKRTDPKRKKRKKREVGKKVPENLEELKEKGKRIAGILEELYPNRGIPLEHENPYQLLVSTLLSAQVMCLCISLTELCEQTTDRMVNKCTPELFKKAPDPQSMAGMEVGL